MGHCHSVPPGSIFQVEVLRGKKTFGLSAGSVHIGMERVLRFQSFVSQVFPPSTFGFMSHPGLLVSIM